MEPIGRFSQYRLPFVLAMALHILLFIALFVHYSVTPHHPALAKTQPHIVHAVAINQTDVEQEMHRIREERHQAKLAEQRHVAEVKAREARALQKLKQIQTQQHQMNQKLAHEKQLAHRQHQQALAEKKRLAWLKKKADLAKQKLKQQKLAAERAAAKAKKIAAELKAKKLAAAKAEALKKAAQKKKRLAELEKKRREAHEKALAENLAKEQERLSAEHEKVLQSEIAKYEALIISTIGHHWRVPANTKKNLSCRLLIELGPGGVVLDVKLLHGSGDAILDRSARNAVFKSSPLPVPKDQELFEKFRELRLTVRPEEVV